ncbi:Zinc finger, BED-type predicted [Ceratobasidium sp. AG-Ba]|nr:Zinc finger, BED-type predicted [Ceratobasidium sp. AG-Ba]
MVVNPCFKFDWIDNYWEQAARDHAYSTVRAQMLKHQRAKPDVGALNVLVPAERAAQALGSGFARILTGGSAITRASSLLANPAYNPYATEEPALPFNPFNSTQSQNTVQDPMIAVESELARWVSKGTVPAQKMGSIELVQFWRLHRFEFPLLYRIAMDVLPVQASSVSSERAFSSSKLTCTRERNLISPENLERLQFLKHALHRQPVSGATGLATQPLDFMAHITHPAVEGETETEPNVDTADSESDPGSGNESDIEYESDYIDAISAGITRCL